ncbi:MAG: head GIN domain-containing protein [Flavobacterium sp.]|nr:head GIN domain-containing protein [Flavobacterium sp.]
MKCIFLTLAVTLASFTTQAQQTKSLVFDANAEARTVGSFTAVEVSGAVDLYLSQSNEEGVAVSASNNEAKSRIKTEVTNGVLHIYADNKGGSWKNWGNTKTKAYVSFKDLKRIEATGACNVIVVDIIKVAALKLDLSGASDFKGEVAVGNLTIGVSGASNMRISGKAEKTYIEASGASNIRGYDLKVDNCRAEASGAANIRITATKDFKAEASGAATIYYKGEANISNVSTSGGASIKKQAD